MNRSRALSLVVAALLCVSLLACGADSSSSPTASTRGDENSGAPQAGGASDTTSRAAPTEAGRGGGGSSPSSSERPNRARREPSFTPRRHHDSGGGADQFKIKGGDNSIQEYGREAGSPEFAEAAAALHDYLDARAARAWSAACRYFGSEATKQFVAQLNQGHGTGGPGCVGLLAALSADVPGAVLRQAAVADVGALRADGNRGYLLFHGAGGTRYFMPMVREGGQWLVGAIAASAVP